MAPGRTRPLGVLGRRSSGAAPNRMLQFCIRCEALGRSADVDPNTEQNLVGTPSGRVEHLTRDSFPWFLGDLDENPKRAAAEFHQFAWKLLLSNPPPDFKRLEQADREDIIADLVARWVSDDCAVLRRYRDDGNSFSGLVAVSANNRAIDHWRKIQRQRKRERNLDEPSDDGVALAERVSDGAVGHDIRYEDRLKLRAVEECLGVLSERCQVLLQGAADGMKPRELTILLGWPPDRNKKVSDAVRECRESLKRCLDKKGDSKDE